VFPQGQLGFEGLASAGLQHLLPMPVVAFFATGLFAPELAFCFFLWGESLDGG
jgi:hypothetical protein